MEKIIPRWEWRTFGESFGEAEKRFAAFTPEKVRESAEVYILSAVSNDNTKVRDLLMDIKTLQQVNEDGLEQWKPIMKGAFPLPVAEIANVFAAFRVQPPAFARTEYTLQQFIDELDQDKQASSRGRCEEGPDRLHDQRLHRRDGGSDRRRPQDAYGGHRIRRPGEASSRRSANSASTASRTSTTCAV